ncbi:hypothetical protein ONZ45_g4245 [Pleurotus djamor]|nr:hypothetical protein ONZ45_g4245 [Pleurotus djamor]
MPRVNYTIDDRSPLIQYNPPGAWRLGSRTLDPLGMRYDNNGTFTLTTDQGASATFTFNGTAIWILGAKRSNHGPYDVNLDNAIHREDGFSRDEQFQFPLFAAEGLVNGLHTVTIINRPVNESFPFLDIDSIVWEAEVEDIAQPQRILPHTDSSFRYEPASAWETPVSSGFNSTTAHSTSTSNASARLNFTGTSITLYGAVSPGTGPYSVQMDDRPPQTFNASVPEYTPQTVMYFADNLGPGVHVMQVVNLPDRPGQGILLDYALLSGESTTSSSSGSSSLSSGAIAGIAVGAVALVALIPLIWFFWRRNRRSQRSDVDLSDDKERRDHDHRNGLPTSMIVTPFTAMSPPIPGTSQNSPSAGDTDSYYPTDMSSTSGRNTTRAVFTTNGGSDSRTDLAMPPQGQHRPTQSSASTSSVGYFRDKSSTALSSPLRTPPPQPSTFSNAYAPVPRGVDGGEDVDPEADMDAPPSYSHASHQR